VFRLIGDGAAGKADARVMGSRPPLRVCIGSESTDERADAGRRTRRGAAVGLIMLDVDDFKPVNDTSGHQQSDVVLRHVARVLRVSSREADTPARYGGEETVLAHTDLEGSQVIVERRRLAIADLRFPRIDQHGVLQVAANFVVTASADDDQCALITDADAARYGAKRHSARTERCGSDRRRQT